MSNSSKYSVYTEFLLKDSKFRKGMNRIDNSVKRMQRSINTIKSTVGSTVGLGTTAAASMGLYLGFGAAKKKLIGYNVEMENLTIGITGATSAMAEFTAADNDVGKNYMMWMQRTPAIMKGLKADAAALVGTTQDFVRSYNMFSGPIAQTGLAKTDKQLVEITRDFNRLAVTGSAVLMGGDIATGTSQLQRMLYGGAGAEMRMAQMMRIVGDEAERFNKLSPADRYAELHKNLMKFKPAVQSYGKSWEGVTSTLQDTLDISTGMIGEPLFEQIKVWVGDTNDWLKEHEEQVADLAETYGVMLRDAIEDFLGFDIKEAKWDDLKGKIDSVSESISLMTTAVKWLGIAWAASKVAGILKGGWGLASGAGLLGGSVAAVGAIGAYSLGKDYVTDIGKVKVDKRLLREYGIYELSETFKNSTTIGESIGAAKLSVEYYGSDNDYEYDIKGQTKHFNKFKKHLSKNNTSFLKKNLPGFLDYELQRTGTQYQKNVEDLKVVDQALVDAKVIAAQVRGNAKLNKNKNKTTVKKKKLPKVKIIQNFHGPMHFDFKLEDIEPDRVAISVEKKFKENLAKQGVGSLFKLGGAL